MHGCAKCSTKPPTLPSALDLEVFTEATRRQLYDLVAAVHFSVTSEERAAHEADPENHWIPTFTPDQAGLVVGRLAGRWFALWTILDAPADLPECRRHALVTITEDPSSPHGVAFHEV
ncbi:MAG TPA: hypothetical protein VHR45_11020 [Thermoanaerobaculia bacterium]|nr:hypothetical protein [Thermoanaerobaculia bacterium]